MKWFTTLVVNLSEHGEMEAHKQCWPDMIYRGGHDNWDTFAEILKLI